MRWVSYVGTEKEVLHGLLQRHRDLFAWKLAGVSDDDARRAMVPSGTSLLGVVQHLAAMEYGWFCRTFGRPGEEMGIDEDYLDADMRVEPGRTSADVLAVYRQACAAADRLIEETDLDTTGTEWGEGDQVFRHGLPSMRWVLAHMLEETARHAGHADILRELIDGTTGYHPRD